MSKTLVYILLLITGLSVGVTVGAVLVIQQVLVPRTAGAVTIQSIECTFSEHKTLTIGLHNNFTDRTLRGNVTVYQNNNQWTGEVEWKFTGDGSVRITCDSIDTDYNFRIVYVEDNPRITYLDRTIEWHEVGKTFVFMQTEQVSITNMVFSGTSGASTNDIVLTVKNTGSSKTTILVVTLNDVLWSDVTLPGELAAGAIGTVTLNNVTWISGNTYKVMLQSATGTNVASYTKKAS